MSTYNAPHNNMKPTSLTVPNDMDTMPRRHYVIILAAAWLGLSTASYHVGIFTHSDARVLWKYYDYITIANLIFIFQTIILCMVIPEAIRRKKNFDIFFYQASGIYFIFLFNALFAPSDKKSKSPSELLYGDNCEIVAIMSGIIALALWVGIIAIAMTVTTGALSHYPYQRTHDSHENAEWRYTKDARTLIFVFQLFIYILWVYILCGNILFFTRAVLIVHTIALCLITLIAIIRKASIHYVLLGTAVVYYICFETAFPIYLYTLT